MKTQIMGGPNMKNFERKFGILRRRLDDMGYRQMLPMEAVPLVERLLNDFMQTTESYMRCKDKADENEKTKCMLEASVEPYREENGKLSQENARLHKRMLRLEEKHHEEELDAKLELRKLRKRFDEMRFMVESYESHMRDMEATERGLREEISKYTSKKARLSDMQNIDLPITLEPQPIKERREPVVQDPYLVDLVKVYDARIAQLESRITEDEALRKKLETELESAKCKVAAREKEIDRLEEILRHGINFDDMSAKASEKEKNLMARQMSLQVEYLEKTVIDLEKRLEVVKSFNASGGVSEHVASFVFPHTRLMVCDELV
ncbi:unnamed protein product [Notodromas monacha]|uniref:Uncharacterized protein n=1 Tax=Notodromas monacha TaxID=399045 RepID=A0A7R9C0B8_9CRUS|nr:unnamed protein product [Notodromas monacha]CAG0925098.1 unnamed protein product [Notodromas monacha]